MALQRKTIAVTSAMIGMAIDRALMAAGLDLSRKKIRQILDSGGVSVNKRVERFASYKVARGDSITVQYDMEVLAPARYQEFKLTAEDILYDEHEFIAINKPPLLASQPSRSPKAPYAARVTEDYLRAHHSPAKLVLCHRLDKETSGILLLARNDAAATQLMEQFKNRKVQKTYLAVSYGIPSKDEWEVSCYLSKLHPKTGLVHKVQAGGNWSHTRFKALAVNQRLKLCLLACFPSTGRTHQIRAHLKLSHLPLVGDKKYVGAKPQLPKELVGLTLEHHFLHARQISFYPTAETKKQVTLTAPLPLQMKLFCQQAKLTLNLKTI